MKNIFTLLFAVGITATSFAQTRGDHQNRPNNNNTQQNGSYGTGSQNHDYGQQSNGAYGHQQSGQEPYGNVRGNTGITGGTPYGNNPRNNGGYSGGDRQNGYGHDDRQVNNGRYDDYDRRHDNRFRHRGWRDRDRYDRFDRRYDRHNRW
jgi:hypothetical protein